jgi:formate dehydrogenase iron-sulfur subunit
VKKLIVQLDLCIGCQAHTVACQRINHGSLTLQSTEVEDAGTLPVVCRHCEEPACVAACPNDAMVKEDDGTVLRNASRCTGCSSCVLACPFGTLSGDMKLGAFAVAKCDLCMERVADGAEPACVATCPTGALRYEEMAGNYQTGREMILGSHAAGYRTYNRRP